LKLTDWAARTITKKMTDLAVETIMKKWQI
jgi:hypothetical protein